MLHASHISAVPFHFIINTTTEQQQQIKFQSIIRNTRAETDNDSHDSSILCRAAGNLVSWNSKSIWRWGMMMIIITPPPPFLVTSSHSHTPSLSLPFVVVSRSLQRRSCYCMWIWIFTMSLIQWTCWRSWHHVCVWGKFLRRLYSSCWMCHGHGIW